MPPRKLTSLYLALLSLCFAVFAYLFANGAAGPKLSWVGLSQARVGLYHRASGVKQISTAAFVDPNETLQGSTSQRLVNSVRSGKLTLHQRDNCLRNTYARACNLPYVEISLGLALGLSVLALGSAVVIWLSGSYAWSLPAFSLTSVLICAAGYGWLEQSRPPFGTLSNQLHTLEVGIYRNLEPPLVKPDPNDPAWLEALNARALQSRSYCRRLSITTSCGVTALEMPLSVPVFLSLGCLVGLVSMALTTVMLRLRQPRPARVFE